MAWHGPWHGMACHAMLCHAMPCYAMLRHAMTCYAMLRHAMTCYAMLCHAVPCCAMLCYAMPCMVPCYATCHAVPCYAMHDAMEWCGMARHGMVCHSSMLCMIQRFKKRAVLDSASHLARGKLVEPLVTQRAKNAHFLSLCCHRTQWVSNPQPPVEIRDLYPDTDSLTSHSSEELDSSHSCHPTSLP